ncbi:hypothetical protein G6L37_11925 [Agrobacterium rubi]|uniref:hypothetical protein n=1 Tax=Agrobacterium rubi TaxID=28099 RepID=UPI001571687F|nr:hypothetical protein [Agrobacterium rubi]NTF06870.1 hypothetical protein [Agrobacterium rubi]NTF19112.1 hypothetical protein [Agrobacterium rubi]NTF26075.1 hypothetical protein [Agrobacterium rubi]
MNFLDKISLALSHNISAGVAGGFVYATVAKEGSFIERLTAVFIGGIFAEYATPVFIDYFDNAIGRSQYFCAFGIGAIGFLTARLIIRLASEYSKKPFLPSPAAIAAFFEAIAARKNNSQKPSDDHTTKS